MSPPRWSRDHVEHQVERRHAAGAREAIAIDREELVVPEDPWKLLAQRRHVLPVDRRAILVEQSRLGQRVSAGAKRAERDVTLGEPAQRGQERRRDRLLDVDAAADEDDVDGADVVERDRRRKRQAVARGDGLAVEARDRPLVDLPLADAVGHAQRLDGARQRDHRIVGQGQEAEPGLRGGLRGGYRLHRCRDRRRVGGSVRAALPVADSASPMATGRMRVYAKKRRRLSHSRHLLTRRGRRVRSVSRRAWARAATAKSRTLGLDRVLLNPRPR